LNWCTKKPNLSAGYIASMKAMLLALAISQAQPVAAHPVMFTCEEAHQLLVNLAKNPVMTEDEKLDVVDVIVDFSPEGCIIPALI